MKTDFKNYAELPNGNLPVSQVIIQTQWEVLDTELMDEVIEGIVQTFDKYNRGHHAINGMHSYSCFISKDDRYIIHFSQWENEQSISYYNENDPKERIPEMLSNLAVRRVGKYYYKPYKRYDGNNHKDSTQVIAFVKQYFDQPEQCKEWIAMILKALKMESPVKGLIGNTYYLSEDGKELLNYALWESEEDYANFLKHIHPDTNILWSEIENFKGRQKEKETIIRCYKFIKVY